MGGLAVAEELGDDVRRLLPRDLPAEALCPLAARYGRTDAEQVVLMTDAVWDATAGQIVSASSQAHLPQTRDHAIGTEDPAVQARVALTKQLAAVYASVAAARTACDTKESLQQHAVADAMDKLDAAELVSVIFPKITNVRVRYVDLSVSEDQQTAVWDRKIGQQKALATAAADRLEPRV